MTGNTKAALIGERGEGGGEEVVALLHGSRKSPEEGVTGAFVFFYNEAGVKSLFNRSLMLFETIFISIFLELQVSSIPFAIH